MTILKEWNDHDSRARYVKVGETVILQHFINNEWKFTKKVELDKCRFCKQETENINADGICNVCETVHGVSSYREPGGWIMILIILLSVSVVIGAFWGAVYYGKILLAWMEETKITSNTEVVLIVLCFLLAILVIGRISFEKKS